MADDFIVEEESSNRTFLYAAGGMGAIFVIGLIIVVVMIMSGRNDPDNAIAIQNMTIEHQNKQVTLTVAQMETVAAYTATPSPLPPTPTWTPIPSFTPTSTPPVQPTAVIQTPEPEEGGGEEVVPTEESGGGATGVELTPTIGPSGGQLPESGMEMWSVIGAAAALTAIIVFARRFRPAA